MGSGSHYSTHYHPIVLALIISWVEQTKQQQQKKKEMEPGTAWQ